jgi:hypothetical protein
MHREKPYPGKIGLHGLVFGSNHLEASASDASLLTLIMNILRVRLEKSVSIADLRNATGCKVRESVCRLQEK